MPGRWVVYTEATRCRLPTDAPCGVVGRGRTIGGAMILGGNTLVRECSFISNSASSRGLAVGVSSSTFDGSELYWTHSLEIRYHSFAVLFFLCVVLGDHEKASVTVSFVLSFLITSSTNWHQKGGMCRGSPPACYPQPAGSTMAQPCFRNRQVSKQDSRWHIRRDLLTVTAASRGGLRPQPATSARLNVTSQTRRLDYTMAHGGMNVDDLMSLHHLGGRHR